MRLNRNIDELMDTLSLFKQTQTMDLHDGIAKIVDAVRGGGKVMWFGNGGSAAQAQHFNAELMVRFTKDRRPIPSIALTADPVLMTAHTNDFSYEGVFQRQLSALGRAGDVAIGISTSGMSMNVINGLLLARDRRMLTVALTGRYPSTEMIAYADVLITVPSGVTARIQEVHELIGHTICQELEEIV